MALHGRRGPFCWAGAATVLNVAALLAASVAAAQQEGKFALPPLPYDYSALEPVIGEQTMRFHHDQHHGTYVSNLNNATADAAPELLLGASLTDAVRMVGTGQLPQDVETAVRNQGGGHWNHAMFMKTMAPPGSANTSRDTALQPRLRQALERDFGSVDAFVAQLSDLAKKHFGSGWAWLCAYSDDSGTLEVVDTLNQDNPLMAVIRQDCTPIMGIDVWEHAFYLDHGPKKAKYVDGWWAVANWAQISDNYEHALQGRPDLIAVAK